jgi:hypothetical protein
LEILLLGREVSILELEALSPSRLFYHRCFERGAVARDLAEFFIEPVDQKEKASYDDDRQEAERQGQISICPGVR